MKRPFIQNQQSGQSTIEFILAMLLILGVTSFFVRLSLWVGVSTYIQYGTFMAARSYLSGGVSVADQRERALNVISKTIKRRDDPSRDRFSSIVKGSSEVGEPPGVEIWSQGSDSGGSGDANLSWMSGVRYTFRGRLLTLVGDTQGQKSGSELVSESFLGREPSSQECHDQLLSLGAIYDNGC